MGRERRASRTSFGDAQWIRSFERDRSLPLDLPDWPKGARRPEGWSAGDHFLKRVILEKKDVLPDKIEELILRFPSAPVHGLQRLQEHHVWLGESENFHTYRILRSSKPSVRDKAVSRIFLMNTGLNERDSMGLYYQIAAHLIGKDETTVCVVRPFPGHLTRFPFPRFAETPLDRYLWDGSHLFRQFMRYMIETQWFLSVLARRSSYRYASGANLVAEADSGDRSRLDNRFLAEAIYDAWLKLRAKSEQSLEATHENTHELAPKVSAPPPLEHFESAIESLRSLLNLDRDYPGRTADEGVGTKVDPALHVIGYSLGGFTAQSIFMSWPFLVASCSTLLGGGALRHLAPSAFAHPEEWQTVLHSLRYELDNRLMSEDIGIGEDSVAGIDMEQFIFFKRTFYEVFQQDYEGSFQTRLAAFRKRMLFVVGGNDPVVRPERVLDSGPPGGLNLLEMGGIGHFLQGRAQSREEAEQRDFWLPEMASVVSHFADRAGENQNLERRVTAFDEDMARPKSTSEDLTDLLGEKDSQGQPKLPEGRLTPSELLAIDHDGALPGATFERCLEDLLARTASKDNEDDGILFMLRNEIPTVLLHDALIRERAASLYHDDVGIVRYCHGVARRREVVRKHIDRICVVLPWNTRTTMERLDLRRGYSSQAETAGGQVLDRVDDKAAWKAFVAECRLLVERHKGSGSLRKFDGNRLLADLPDSTIPEDLRAIATRLAGHESPARVPSLPDCWVWASADILGASGPLLTVDRGIREMARIVPDLCMPDNWEERLLEALRTEQLRIVTVSRARYNPRFRGRLLVTPQSARTLLVHATLSLALSQAVTPENLATAFEPSA